MDAFNNAMEISVDFKIIHSNFVMKNHATSK